MTEADRFNSIDILKGFSVLFILFANALYMPETLPVFSDSPVKSWGFLVSEWAIISFVFLFGMTVPFIISKKINNGLTAIEISRGIFSKTLVFLVIGILLVNSFRISAEFTGFNSYIYSIIVLCAIFLLWFRYTDEEGKFFTVTGLRLLGMALLIFILFKFRSGTFENGGTLIPGWWEVPGLIGWGYLVTAFTYLAFRNSIIGTGLIWIMFLALSVLSKLGMTDDLDPLKLYIGPLTEGSFPFIMLSGNIAGLILKKYSETEFRATAGRLILYGVSSIIAGIVIDQLLIKANSGFMPSTILMADGVIILLFLLLYWYADVKKYGYRFGLIKPAGEYYFTGYLFPILIYNLLMLAGANIFFFRQYGLLVNIAGSLTLAIIMMILSSLAIRMNIRLKI
jgi:predicted acyltransferase